MWDTPTQKLFDGQGFGRIHPHPPETKGRLQKKKTDSRTLSQKVDGGPDQIPKIVVCEIGIRVGSQTPICPNFKTDLKTKDDL